jgi:hypothetical protein
LLEKEVLDGTEIAKIIGSAKGVSINLVVGDHTAEFPVSDKKAKSPKRRSKTKKEEEVSGPAQTT